MCLIMKHIRELAVLFRLRQPYFDCGRLFRYSVIPNGPPAICSYSATMVPNPLQGLVALYASSDSAGTWSVAEEMGAS